MYNLPEQYLLNNILKCTHLRLIYLSVVLHVDDNDGDSFASQEFARVPSSGGSLYYTNGESSDTVWPSMYV